LSADKSIARFEGVRFSKADFQKLQNPNISVLINIYSGRRPSGNNLLDYGIMELNTGQFMQKRFLLGCKLIAEPPIPELTDTSGFPLACLALLENGEATNNSLCFLVNCSESGRMKWAG
jgi:hypothetical protein